MSPGATDTDLLRRDNPGVDEVVAFLVGPGGRWVTGQDLRAGGGLA